MSKLMTSFGKETVVVDVVSEANAVNNKINVAGITNYSKATGRVYLNDTLISGTFANGLNVFKIVDRKLTETKTFDTSTSAGIDAFIYYMDNLTNGVIVIASGKNLKSSDTLYNWFIKKSSVNFPLTFFANLSTISVGYCGIYSVPLKAITHECHLLSDGSNTNRAEIELVYNDQNDLGANGIPLVTCQDAEEYKGTTYEIIRYPTTSIIGLLTDYNLSVGDTIYVGIDMFDSKDFRDAGLFTRLSVRFFKDTTILSSFNIDNNGEADKFNRLDGFYTIPANTNGISFVVNRYPRTDSNTSEAIVKNFVCVRASKSRTDKEEVVFGVNGIQMNNLNDGTSKAPIIAEFRNALKGIDVNNMVENEFKNSDFYLNK